jgi:hypothetical protein
MLSHCVGSPAQRPQALGKILQLQD